jgi:hypothetical protein
MANNGVSNAAETIKLPSVSDLLNEPLACPTRRSELAEASSSALKSSENISSNTAATDSYSRQLLAHQSIREFAVHTPKKDSLRNAIQDAPSELLRDLVCELVNEHSTAEAFLRTRLMVPLEASSNVNYMVEHTCKRCKGGYQVEQNSGTACDYHKGWFD